MNKDNIGGYRMKGRPFGDIPMFLDLRLSGKDSPNSAGVAIDIIRGATLAIDRAPEGVLIGPSAYFCKHPLRKLTDDKANRMS